MRSRTAFAVLCVFLALLLGHRPALAEECPQSNAMGTPVWDNFRRFVHSEYLRGRDFSSRDVAYIYGHALGRAAAAVDQVPLREQAFACLDRALDQAIHADLGSEGPARLFYRLAQEAAMGMHDARVAELTGVSTGAPVPEIYGAAPEPRPSPTSRTAAGSGSAARSSPRLYDCDEIDGTLQYYITGEMIYGADDPRAARMEPTSVTLVGNAMVEFQPEKARDYLRRNPGSAGHSFVMWMDGGEWKSARDRTPSLRCRQRASTAGDPGSSSGRGSSPGSVCANDAIRPTGNATVFVHNYTVKGNIVCGGSGRFSRITGSSIERWRCRTREYLNCELHESNRIIDRSSRNGRTIIRYETEDGSMTMTIRPH